MKYNNEWVYRDIHGYNILINMRNNRILSISSKLAELFSMISNSDEDFELLLGNWKNGINDNIDTREIVAYLEKKGVVIDE